MTDIPDAVVMFFAGVVSGAVLASLLWVLILLRMKSQAAKEAYWDALAEKSYRLRDEPPTNQEIAAAQAQWYRSRH